MGFLFSLFGFEGCHEPLEFLKVGIHAGLEFAFLGRAGELDVEACMRRCSGACQLETAISLQDRMSEA